MSNHRQIDRLKYENVIKNYNENLMSLEESCKASNITIRTYYNICKRLGKQSVATINQNINQNINQPRQQNIGIKTMNNQPKRISETSNKFEISNKFGSSEPTTRYVTEPIPRRGSKSSEIVSNLCIKTQQEVLEKNLVSEGHYDNIEPMRTLNEPKRQGSRLKPLDMSKYNKPTIMPKDIVLENI